MSRYHCFCHFARVHYVIIKASHDGCWGLYQSKAGWPGVKSQQQYFQSPISVNNSRESASRGSPLFAHQQQPRSLLLLHSTTHTKKKKKTCTLAHPKYQMAHRHNHHWVSLSAWLILRARMQEPGRRAVKAPRRSAVGAQAECGRAGLRAVKTKLSASNAFVFSQTCLEYHSSSALLCCSFPQ